MQGASAWAEAGLTAAEYSAGVGSHGFATGFGDTGSVGIGGITLGGGIGYLRRKYGLTIDSLLAAEIVTAEKRESSTSTLRPTRTSSGRSGAVAGTSGVTLFRYRLHPVDQIVGGLLMLPATPEIVTGPGPPRRKNAPEELSAIINVMPAPPLPFVPQEHHGRLIVMILSVLRRGCRGGRTRDCTVSLRLATPIVDMVRPMRYPEIFPPDDPSFHPTAVGQNDVHRQGRSRCRPDDPSIILQRSDAGYARCPDSSARRGHGSRTSSDATAFAHRNSRIWSSWRRSTTCHDRPNREAWVESVCLLPCFRGTAARTWASSWTINEASVRTAYPGSTWDRPAAVKARTIRQTSSG